MIERINTLVIMHKTAVLAVFIVLLIGVAYALGRHASEEKTAAEKPAVLMQEQTQNAASLRAQLDIRNITLDLVPVLHRQAEIQNSCHDDPPCSQSTLAK